MRAVLDNSEIPQRASSSCHLADQLWNLWVRCWDKDPSARPTATETLKVKKEFQKPSYWYEPHQVPQDLEADTSLPTSRPPNLQLGRPEGDDIPSQEEDFPSTPTLTTSLSNKVDTMAPASLPLHELRFNPQPPMTRWNRAPFQDHIEKLSDELLRSIFRWFLAGPPRETNELGRLQLVCRRWRRIVRRDET